MVLESGPGWIPTGSGRAARLDVIAEAPYLTRELQVTAEITPIKTKRPPKIITANEARSISRALEQLC